VICTFTVLGVNGNPQTISTLITSKWVSKNETR
jgi:hypothetical protein